MVVLKFDCHYRERESFNNTKMRFYLSRSNEEFCIDERILLNALDLALLFGCYDVTSIRDTDFSSSTKERGLPFDCKPTLAEEGIYYVAPVEAQSLALAVERALQANPGAMYVMAVALDHSAAFGLFKDLMAQSYTPLNSLENGIFRNHVESDEHMIFFQRFVDFVGSLTKHSAWRTSYTNRFSRALRRLMLIGERETLRQLVAFCRCGGFSIRLGSHVSHLYHASGLYGEQVAL